MARSQLRHNVKDAAGNVIQNALCYVYSEGTTTAVTDLYTASSGGSTVTTLTSNGQGEIVGYLDTPKRVDIKVTDNSNTAYYPSRSGTLLDWTDFTETVEVLSTGTTAASQTACISGTAYVSSQHGSRLSTAQVAARMYASPIWIPRTITIDRIGCEVTVVAASGGVVRLGIYNDLNTLPGTLLLETAALPVDAGAGTAPFLVEATVNQQLDRGLYWLAFVNQTQAVTVRTIGTPGYVLSLTAPTGSSVPACYRQLSVTSTLPNPMTPDLSTLIGTMPLVWVRAVFT